MSDAFYLSQTERDAIMKDLSDTQQDFLINFLKRGKRTGFANVLAREKAGLTSEGTLEIAEQWEFLDYLDAGPDWRSTSHLYCECGRHLRYQYILKNKKTGKIKRFGKDHFEQHTGIPALLARKINKGFEKIDYELDEILHKINTNWELLDEGITNIPQSVEIDKDIQSHFDYHIPLLQRQVDRLKNKLAAFNHELEIKRRREREVVQAQKADQIKADSLLKAEAMSKSAWWLSVRCDTGLEEDLQLGIIVYIKELGSTSFTASSACEYIVTYHNASSSTFSSGTYKVFPDVCMFLDELVMVGRLQHEKKIAGQDRSYKIVDPFLLNNNMDSL